MINDENLEKIYAESLSEDLIKTKVLTEFGFTSKDINKLLEDSIIEREKRGSYKLISIDGLFQYGKKLLSENEFDLAYKCFMKVYELDSNNYQVCFELFKRCIELKEYEKSLEFLRKMSLTEDEVLLHDYHFNLLLLSYVYDLPDDLRNEALKLKLSDVKLADNDSRYKDNGIENENRKLLFNKKISNVRNNYNRLEEKNENAELTKVFLNALVEKYRVDSTKAVELFKEKKFDELEEFYNNEKSKRKLSRRDFYALKLLRDLKYIKDNGYEELSKSTVYYTVTDAIDGKDYRQALRISKDFNSYNNSTNIIYLLLETVNSEINKNNNNGVFSSLIFYLNNNNFDKLNILLDEYLNKIGKNDYKFIVLDLIKVSISENDLDYLKPLSFLSSLNKTDFSFDVHKYIGLFYEALSVGNFDIARAYFDIISKVDRIGIIPVNTEGLAKLLDMYEKKEEERLDSFDIYEDLEPIDSLDDWNLDPDRELIKEKREKLIREGGILRLDPMPSERRKKIHGIVKEYKDITSFSILEGEERQVLLRYKPNSHYLDYKNIIRNGNRAYRDNDFDRCIYSYNLLLESANFPKPFIYGKIGLSYLKKGDKKKAIDYLTVATYLSKKQHDNQSDYTELLEKIKSSNYEERKVVVKEEKKSQIKNRTRENNYGINNFDEVIKFITENNIDIESSGIDLNLTEEERDIVKLIYAREFYKQGDLDSGDVYLNAVVKTPNKSPLVVSLIGELQKRKRFYKNSEEKKLLITRVLPGKRKLNN